MKRSPAGAAWTAMITLLMRGLSVQMIGTTHPHGISSGHVPGDPLDRREGQSPATEVAQPPTWRHDVALTKDLRHPVKDKPGSTT